MLVEFWVTLRDKCNNKLKAEKIKAKDFTDAKKRALISNPKHEVVKTRKV